MEIISVIDRSACLQTKLYDCVMRSAEWMFKSFFVLQYLSLLERLKFWLKRRALAFQSVFSSLKISYSIGRGKLLLAHILLQTFKAIVWSGIKNKKIYFAERKQQRMKQEGLMKE